MRNNVGSKPGNPTRVAQKGHAGSVEKQEDLVVMGFRVKLKEEGIIQDYENRMYCEYIVDATTKQPRRMRWFPLC
jgi:hypothetical protein